MPELRKLCPGAALVTLANQKALDLAASLAGDPPEGLLDAVPGACTLLLVYDPRVLDVDRLDLSRTLFVSSGRRRHASRGSLVLYQCLTEFAGPDR